MSTFASQLAVLTEKAIIANNETTTQTSSNNTKQQMELKRTTTSTTTTQQLTIKELELSKLEGNIIQLAEDLPSLSLANDTNGQDNNNSYSQNIPMNKLQIEYNALRKKHKHLESRHSSLARDIQVSMRNKDKIIITLKNALKQKDDGVDQRIPYIHSNTTDNDMVRHSSKEELDIESSRKLMEERNALIDEMMIEIEYLTTQKPAPVVDEADKIRLRYLEGIVHELEQKLAVATGATLRICKYGSISLYDIDNSWPYIENNKPSNEEGGATSYLSQ